MKITKEGIAVIEGDSYLSADIIAQGRLDVARDFLEQYRRYIPEGGVVVDVGACLGDFTATFSDFVGPNGEVHAFEPNPEVFECMRHNLKDRNNVLGYQAALGLERSLAALNVDQHNIGASWLSKNQVGMVTVLGLDDVSQNWTRLDFMKIDAEGYEPWILDGGIVTITRLRPVMLIEVDQRALSFQQFQPMHIHIRLDAFGYEFPRFDGAHGDILCVPKERA